MKMLEYGDVVMCEVESSIGIMSRHPNGIMQLENCSSESVWPGQVTDAL